jgi:ribosome-binding ATPase YchF (GTP1/OBG family)
MFESEFDLWLLNLIRKDWDRVARTAEAAREGIDRHLEEKLTGLKIDRSHIAAAVQRTGLNSHRARNWNDEDLAQFVTELRKVSKPLIVAANKADREHAEENVDRLESEGYLVVPTCAEAELALRRATSAGLINYTPGDGDYEDVNPSGLSKEQRRGLEMIREKVFKRWGTTGVQEAINAAFFRLLDSILVYPVEDADSLTDHEGRILPDCFLVPRGMTAGQFAGLIHTELGESFIYAVDARTKKRLGEDYVLHDNDVIQIVAAKARR